MSKPTSTRQPAPINFYTSAYYALDNFSAHAIKYRDQSYPTAEHAFQAAKCLLAEGKAAIRQARSPLEAKRLANTAYRAHRDPDWTAKKVAIMEEILRAKLAQHPEVGEILAASGTHTLIEGSPSDYFWGTGADGTGQNILGQLWMKLRTELLEENSAIIKPD